MRHVEGEFGVLISKVPGEASGHFIRALVAGPQSTGVSDNSGPSAQYLEFIGNKELPRLQPESMIEQLRNAGPLKSIDIAKIVFQRPRPATPFEGTVNSKQVSVVLVHVRRQLVEQAAQLDSRVDHAKDWNSVEPIRLMVELAKAAPIRVAGFRCHSKSASSPCPQSPVG